MASLIAVICMAYTCEFHQIDTVPVWECDQNIAAVQAVKLPELQSASAMCIVEEGWDV